jgi:hypothetical protein
MLPTIVLIENRKPVLVGFCSDQGWTTSFTVSIEYQLVPALVVPTVWYQVPWSGYQAAIEPQRLFGLRCRDPFGEKSQLSNYMFYIQSLQHIFQGKEKPSLDPWSYF